MVELQALGLDAIRVFAVACACRIQVVVGHFGQLETKMECERILDELWTLANTGNHLPAACANLRRRLEELPEASVDDPYRRGYFAMRALGVVADAISAVGEANVERAREAASAASDGAISLAADIAFEAAQVDSTRQLPDSEERAEAEILRMIESSPSGLVDRLRQFCQEDTWSAELLDEIDRRRGWIRGAPR